MVVSLVFITDIAKRICLCLIGTRWGNAPLCPRFFLAALVMTAAALLPVSLAHAETELLSQGIDIVPPAIIQDYGGPDLFELEPPITEVRVAANNFLDQYGDTLEASDFEEENLDWDVRFKANADGQIEEIPAPEKSEFELLPSFELNSPPGIAGLVSAHSALNSQAETMTLMYEVEADEAEEKKAFQGVIRVNPEPSGWTLTVALLSSLLVIGFCARLLRPRREEIRSVDFGER